MISMQAAAQVFNKAVFTDINNENEFVAQLLTFDDNKRSGDTSRRRILEVSPEIEVPKVVVEVNTPEVFIVAIPSTDFFNKNPVRKKYPVIPAESAYSIKSVREILEVSAGYTEWGVLNYLRREGQEFTSDYLGGYVATFPSTVSVLAGQYISAGDSSFRAREDSYIDELGFSVVEVVKLPNVLQTLDITVKGVFDPVTETYAGDVTTSVSCIVEEREKSYTDIREDYEKVQGTDVTISTLHDSAVGTEIDKYIVINKDIVDTVNVLHCRRT